MNILVLCTGNSARSILLEAILNRLGDGRITAFSAGSDAAGQVNPYALTLLRDLGYDTDGFRSKSWDEFAEADAPVMDIVITVCGGARDTTCPMWPGAPVSAHWGVEDPSAVEGSDADISAAFQQTYDLLLAKAEAFLALPVEKMPQAQLHQALSEVANA